MNRWLRFSGLLGLVFLIFGLFPAFTLGFDFAFSNPLVLLHLILGALCIVTWVVSSALRSPAPGGTTGGKSTASRIARYGANAALASVVFIGLLIVGNWFAHRYDQRWDLTEEGVYSLAPQSKDIVSNLKEPLKLVGLTGPAVFRLGKEAVELKEVLERYKQQNLQKVSVQLFDPESKVHLLDQYGFKQGNLLYIEYGKGEKKGVSRINEGSEEAITNAILKVQRGASKKVYYVTGHDEPSLKSVNPDGLKKLAESLGDEHITLEELFLGDKSEMPADSAAVIVVSPKRPFVQSEKDLLIKYVENGGRALLLTDPRTTTDVKDIASHFGIEVGENVILDQQRKLFQGPTIGVQPIVNTYEPHAITKAFTPQDVTIFSMVASVSIKGKSEKGVTYTELLKTGPNAWGETNISALLDQDPPQAEMNENDLKGPVSLGVVYEKKIEPSKTEGDAKEGESKIARLVVIGDSDWMINANLDVYKNRDLIMNAVQWIAGEDGGVSIRPRSIRRSLAPIGESEFMRILAASFLVPEIILLSGLLVWWRRRTIATA